MSGLSHPLFTRIAAMAAFVAYLVVIGVVASAIAFAGATAGSTSEDQSLRPHGIGCPYVQPHKWSGCLPGNQLR